MRCAFFIIILLFVLGLFSTSIRQSSGGARCVGRRSTDSFSHPPKAAELKTFRSVNLILRTARIV